MRAAMFWLISVTYCGLLDSERLNLGRQCGGLGPELIDRTGGEGRGLRPMVHQRRRATALKLAV